MLQKFVKNIRAKPESVRRGITLGISLGVTTIVAFFWFISFLNYSNQVLTAKPKVESPTSFIGKMSTLIGESYANVHTKISPASNGFFGEKADENIGENTEVDSATSTTDTEEINGKIEADSGSVETEIETVRIEPKTDTSKGLSDILNTKKPVKQDDGQSDKATTSGEVLVQ